jgi:carboxymethylenebutenolidase
MNTRIKMVAGIFLAGMLAAIVMQAAEPKTENVQFKSGTDMVNGYLATPAAAGRHGAIIVIHEWWGLNDWVKEQTVKLAGQGYVALAVDLYRGKSASNPDEAHELMRGLPQDRGLRDLQAAYDYLAARPDVDKDRIGVIGWCMGGGYAIQFAIHQPHLAACVVNYGALPTDPEDLARLVTPVLGNFGADDKGITPTDVQAFEKALKKMTRFVDVKIYPGAGHAFENPNNQSGYRPEAAADAWTRTIDFLKKTLK